jgi:hypothetical protein
MWGLGARGKPRLEFLESPSTGKIFIKKIYLNEEILFLSVNWKWNKGQKKARQNRAFYYTK